MIVQNKYIIKGTELVHYLEYRISTALSTVLVQNWV